VAEEWAKLQKQKHKKGVQIMEMVEVKSSNIKAIGYDGTTLRIEFKGGGFYDYQDVPEVVFESLMESDSKGGFFHKEIKDNYKFNKVEEDTTEEEEKSDRPPVEKEETDQPKTEEEEPEQPPTEEKTDQPTTQDITDFLSKRIKSGVYDYINEQKEGIRSRQIVALIDLLVEKGIL
jgi:hypothetical protein